MSELEGILKIISFALAGVAQWVESQARFSVGACKRQPIDVSLTHQCFSPSLPLSLRLSLKINK